MFKVQCLLIKNHSGDHAEKGDQIGEFLIIQGIADSSQTRVMAVQMGGVKVYIGRRTYRILSLVRYKLCEKGRG